MGLVMVAHSELPAHLAIDNSSVVRKGNKILEHIAENKAVPPNLSMQKDRELWSMFANAIMVRGAKSFRISKTQDHALQRKACFGEVPSVAS